MMAPVPLELVAVLLAALLIFLPQRLAFAGATAAPVRRLRAKLRQGFDVVCMETAALAAVAVSAIAAAGTAVYSGQQQAAAAKSNAQAQAAQYAEEQRAARLALVFLQGYGISPALSMKIFKAFGDRTQAVVRANPYQLVERVEGIGFKTADAIAHSIGIEPESPERLSCALHYVLEEASATARYKNVWMGVSHVSLVM